MASNKILYKLNIDLSTTWMSNTIDWEYSSNLSLMSISSYVGYETGNIYETKQVTTLQTVVKMLLALNETYFSKVVYFEEVQKVWR